MIWTCLAAHCGINRIRSSRAIHTYRAITKHIRSWCTLNARGHYTIIIII